eukprot:CAMPEP_0115163690 /NCGR_PEP_ID=MMETSP0227-20121206/72643_1 /TAXON_ID=89957 /ORGANISM="Polarella glacialis, Strain CCMP 1383" /LENGTH=1035 /DNA_ID=CAMNT_0002576011 /DNA_START=38 /DNA_END=3145 /DNA_ORIENTATION=-
MSSIPDGAVLVAASPVAVASTSSAPGLSEAWAVDARHVGCYTGGKVAWSESTQVLGCLCDEELHLVDAYSQAPTRQVAHEGDGVLTFAIDPSGLNACTSHRSGLLRHFRLGEKPTLVRSWRGHEQVIADVSFDSRGDLVATGSVDRTAKVFDFTGYFCTHNFKGHPGIVALARFHPSRLQLVTISDAEARLWDLESSRCVGIMKDHLSTISSLSFGKTKAGTYELVTGGRDQVVNVWKLEEKCSLVRSLPVFEIVEGVASVPTKGLRQLCSEGGAAFGALGKWLEGEKMPPPYLVFTVGNKGLVRAWNPADGKLVASHESPHAAKGELRQIHCLDGAAGRKLLTVGEDLNLMIWSLPEFEVCSHIMGHNEDIVHVQLIPQIRWPEESPADATGSADSGPSSGIVTADRFVCIANDEHPRVVNCQGFSAFLLRGHTDVVISCDVSPDGQWIATGGKDQTVRVWRAADGKIACVLPGHSAAVSGLSFGKKRPRNAKVAAQQQQLPLWLVSASQDKTMKIWELPSAAKLAEAASKGAGGEAKVKKSSVTVVAHTKEVNDVVVSPNNKLIASAGQDKLVRIWKFPEGDLLGELKGHQRGVWSVAFSPIDQVIASAAGDATVRLWNLKDFMPIRAFQGHSSAVLRVAFLANGMQLMSSSVDGLLKLWQIRTAECAATFEEHEGKVWCIDVVGNRMVSGGSDSKLCVWRDSTVELAKERQDATAEVAMKDSRIGLLVREGKIEAALTLALDLNRPGQMKQILCDHTMEVVGRSMYKKTSAPETAATSDAAGESVAPTKGGLSKRGGKKFKKKRQAAPVAGEADADKETSPDASDRKDIDLRRWVLSLSTAQLERLVELLEQWNTNRRMAPLAQMLFGILLLSVPPPRITALEGMNATCGNVLSYASRHMSRVDSLLQKTFLFDLVLQSSGLGLALQDGEVDAENGTAEGGAEVALKRTMEVLLGPGDEDSEDEEDDEGDEMVGEEADDQEDEDDDYEPVEALPQADSGKIGRHKRREAPAKDPDAGSDAELPSSRRKKARA